MQESLDYTPRPFDLQSLSSDASATSTPPRLSDTPTSLTLSATLISSLNQLTNAFEAAKLDDPLDPDVLRKEAIFRKFQRDIGMASSLGGGAEVEIDEGEEGGIAAEEAHQSFVALLEKSIAEKEGTLRVIQHDHEETIRRLSQAHEETIRKMTQDREETNRRMVQDIAAMVREERSQ
ncbi:hypothetical protein RQP46_009684 [Phenoliferia psychrophenolica]